VRREKAIREKAIREKAAVGKIYGQLHINIKDIPRNNIPENTPAGIATPGR